MTTSEMFKFNEETEASGNPQTSTNGVLTTEAEVAEAITQQIMNDPLTRDYVIEVVNQRGVVTLVGEVQSQQSREAAEQIATAHPDVISVINGLKITQ